MKSCELKVTEHFADGTIRVTKWGDRPPLKLPPELNEEIHKMIAQEMMARLEVS